MKINETTVMDKLKSSCIWNRLVAGALPSHEGRWRRRGDGHLYIGNQCLQQISADHTGIESVVAIKTHTVDSITGAHHGEADKGRQNLPFVD